MADSTPNIGRMAVDMAEVLRDMTFPVADRDSLDVLFHDNGNNEPARTAQKDLFAVRERKSWDKSQEARCDFTYRLRISPRAKLLFISIWQKSIYGRTLTDIKGDPDMVAFFAENICPVIRDVVGTHLKDGDWCIVTSPKRRHKQRNFATLIAARLANMLDIPFYEDAAVCRSKHRVNAVFELGVLPKERNVIVYDDFVTTGSTLGSMKRLLEPLGKNLIFFTNVNNKL